MTSQYERDDIDGFSINTINLTEMTKTNYNSEVGIQSAAKTLIW